MKRIITIGIGIIVITAIVAGFLNTLKEKEMGATIPVVPALFRTTLATKISSTATSMTLTTGTDKSGDALAGYICFAIDEGMSSEEFVCGTTAGTAVTSMIRGIDPVDGDTEVTSLKKAHRRGAIVKVTNYPQLGILSRILNGDETLPNIITYAAANTFTAGSNQVPSVKYVDDVSIAGAADGTTTTKGLFEMATTAEILTVVTTGSTGAYLVAPNSLFDDDFSATTIIPVTGTDGKLAQGFIDLTEDFNFTGLVATTTSGNFNALTIGTNADIAGDLDVIGDINLTSTAGDILYSDGTTLSKLTLGTQNYYLVAGASAPAWGGANLNEANTFFGATDITGAEAETLTDSSDAGGKHYHAVKLGQTTRTNAGGTGNQDIAHGLGRTPIFVRIITIWDAGSNRSVITSYGHATSTADEECQVMGVDSDDTGDVANTEQVSGQIIALEDFESADMGRASLGALDSTNITLTWGTAVNASGTAYIQWEVW